MDIARILQNFDVIEGRLSPVSTRHGLTPQQDRSHQLPALFKPKKISVLKNHTDPKHPTTGYFVGDAVEPDVAQTPLEEAMRNVEEDMITKTRANLRQYLDMLSQKNAEHRDLIQKTQEELEKTAESEQDVQEDPTESDPAPDPTPAREMTASGSLPVKTVAMEDGNILEIHGNEHEGFKIGYKGHTTDLRFPTIDQAETALNIYRARKQRNLNQDYIDEK